MKIEINNLACSFYDEMWHIKVSVTLNDFVAIQGVFLELYGDEVRCMVALCDLNFKTREDLNQWNEFVDKLPKNPHIKSLFMDLDFAKKSMEFIKESEE